MSVTLEDTAPYQQVLVYEKVHDEPDKPMHKSHGNSIEFNAAAEKRGADVMRWIYAGQNVKVNLRFGFGIADETVRRLLTLWNTYSFFVTYANLDGFDPSKVPAVAPAQRSELDRWVLSRLHELIRNTNRNLGQFDSASVTRDVEAFVSDLSNWYVRRSRRRFWKATDDGDKRAAYWTLYEVLTTLTRLIAPIMPFLAEHLYQNLVAGVDKSQPESVHLTPYPVADESLIDEALMSDVALVERVVELARAARARTKLKVRQPLREIMVHVRNDEEAEALRTHTDQVLDELNIKRLLVVDDPAELVSYVIKPNLPVLGPKLGKRLGAARAGLAALDPAEVAAKVAAGEVIHLPPDGADEEPLLLAPDEVLVETKQKEGFVVEQEKGLVVALDTTLTEELRQEGMARDLVRTVQELRKAAGFAISDRISLTYQVDGGNGTGERLAAMLARFGDYIQQETLSTSLAEAPPPAGAHTGEDTLDGVTLRLAVCRV
jgi:isoleucyl-tRNA synthetase